MPRNKDIKKVLVIGSGPIVIGQAAEFDYAGTQACRSLKEEGVEVVLVNSNPATIMTDKEIADEVYIEPLTVDVLEKIIAKEKPDSVLPTLGGQAGLNLGMELAEQGVLDKYGVKLIGTTAETIFKAEDRQAFKDTMDSWRASCRGSWSSGRRGASPCRRCAASCSSLPRAFCSRTCSSSKRGGSCCSCWRPW